MEQSQCLIQAIGQHPTGNSSAFAAFSQSRLNEFQIPIAQLPPHKITGGSQGDGRIILFQAAGHSIDRLIQRR